MNKKILTLTSLVLLLSLGFSLFQGYRRHLAEETYNSLQILIHYDDLQSFSRLTGQSLEEVSLAFKDAGVTGVLVKERTIRATLVNAQNSLEQNLDAVTYSGIELLSRKPGVQGVEPNRFYGWIPNDSMRKSVMTHINWKRGYGDLLVADHLELVDYGPADVNVLALGVGYPVDHLKTIAATGLTISPQVKDWDSPTTEALEAVINEIAELPGLGDVYFNDVTIPPINSAAMKRLAQNHTIGYIEFFSNRQRGIGELIKMPSDGDSLSMIRLHSITGQQLATRPKRQNMNQLLLAVNERNIRAVLIGFPLVGEPNTQLEFALDFVSDFKSNIVSDGFVINSETVHFNLPLQSGYQIFIIGLGPILALVFLGEIIQKQKISYILAILGVLGYLGLLYLNPYLAKQAMALYASILFPVLGVLYAIGTTSNGYLSLIKRFLVASSISLMGSITVVGILSEATYAMGIQQFRGVKLVSVVPLVLLTVIIMIKDGGFEWAKIKTFLLKYVNYITMIAILIGAVVLFRYVQRTGNTATVSNLELTFRQLLTEILGVRPRTKEFLIAHPIFMMLLWVGYEKKWLAFLLVGLIGQVSMVNTFAHLHTPVMVSLIRTFHGLWIGMIFGLVGIFVLNQFKKIMIKGKLNG